MISFKEYHSLKDQVREYLHSLNVCHYLGFDEDLIDCLATTLITKIQFGENYNRSCFYYVLMNYASLIYNSIYGILFFRGYSDKRLFYKKNIFVQNRSLYNRTYRILPEIDDSCAVYMPSTSFKNMKKHLRQHKEAKNNVFIVKYNLHTILAYSLCIIKITPLLRKLLSSKNSQLDGSVRINKLALVLILKYLTSYFACKDLYKRVTDKTLFIMEHDKCENTLVLKKIRKEYNLHYRIGTLNHGAFYGFNLAYVCPISDFELCTCERERKLVTNYSDIKESNVLPVGTPIQSFDNGISYNYGRGINELLVLGTICSGEWYDIQVDLIKYLKENGIPFKYRTRPGTAQYDMKKLEGILEKEDYTKGTTLLEDCANYQNIISFSLDALGMALRLERAIAIYLPPEVFNQFSPIGEGSKQVVITSCISEVEGFIKGDKGESGYDKDTLRWIVANFGELSFEKVIENIKSALQVQRKCC